MLVPCLREVSPCTQKPCRGFLVCAAASAPYFGVLFVFLFLVMFILLDAYTQLRIRDSDATADRINKFRAKINHAFYK